MSLEGCSCFLFVAWSRNPETCNLRRVSGTLLGAQFKTRDRKAGISEFLGGHPQAELARPAFSTPRRCIDIVTFGHVAFGRGGEAEACALPATVLPLCIVEWRCNASIWFVSVSNAAGPPQASFQHASSLREIWVSKRPTYITRQPT